MNKKLSTIAALVPIASAIAVPSIALGNARRSEGSLSAMQAAENPYVAQLAGANEVPGGDARRDDEEVGDRRDRDGNERGLRPTQRHRGRGVEEEHQPDGLRTGVPDENARRPDELGP